MIVIAMGSVSISLIKMGNLFLINKIFTCGNICTNDENLRTQILQLKSLVVYIKHVYNTKVDVIKRIRTNTDLHNQEDLNG